MPFATWSKEAAASVLATTCDKPGPVLISLQAIQEEFGYVPGEALALVADACNVSRADVHGVLTFYHDLRTTPPPVTSVRICVAEACQAVGSSQLVDAVEATFNTTLGSESADVEIKAVYCFGNCALGPNATVNGRLIGRAKIADLLSHTQGNPSR